MKKIKYLICMLLLLFAAPVLFVACDSKELTDLRNKVESLEEENSTLEIELEAKKSSYNLLFLVRQEQDNELAELREEVAALEADIETKTANINSLSARIAQLEEAQAELILSNTTLDNELKAVQAELATTEADLSQKIADLAKANSTIANKNAELTQKESELATLNTQISSLEAEIAELEEAVENLNNENTSLKNENSDLKNENDALKETTSEMVIYQGKTFAAEASAGVDVTPVLEDGKTYMFVGCTFTNGLTSTAEGIDARFYNCTFNSDGEKSLYLTSFINLEVVGCTFQTELGDLSWSTANYGIDLDIYNTTVQNITISYNNFEGLTNESSATNPCVAISIKVRLGENDNPTDEFWADKTEGKILGTVTIEGNNFSIENNSLYLGTNPKGEDTEANLSSGAFDVVVRNTDEDALNVYERYLYNEANEDQVPAQVVEAGTNANFGNKTELPTNPTE